MKKALDAIWAELLASERNKDFTLRLALPRQRKMTLNLWAVNNFEDRVATYRTPHDLLTQISTVNWENPDYIDDASFPSGID